MPDVEQRRHPNFVRQAVQLTDYSDDILVAIGEVNRPLRPLPCALALTLPSPSPSHPLTPHRPHTNSQLPVRPAVVPCRNLLHSLVRITLSIVKLYHPEASYPWQHITNKLFNTPAFATEANVIRA